MAKTVTRPLVIDDSGRDAELPEAMSLLVSPASGEYPDEVMTAFQTQALVQAALESMFQYKIQYSTTDIQAGVAKLPTGCVYLVYE
ncbi:MAG: hypothetical protein LBP87_13450 [Planctomycetaceae bacterium]|jgi:hypothetical protein|nr:hypothetical protein [Planctomycetaceae bacterium]